MPASGKEQIKYGFQSDDIEVFNVRMRASVLQCELGVTPCLRIQYIEASVMGIGIAWCSRLSQTVVQELDAIQYVTQ